MRAAEHELIIRCPTQILPKLTLYLALKLPKLCYRIFLQVCERNQCGWKSSSQILDWNKSFEELKYDINVFRILTRSNRYFALYCGLSHLHLKCLFDHVIVRSARLDEFKVNYIYSWGECAHASLLITSA